MRLLLITLSVLAVVAFTSLGIWQLERRTWKLNLIAQTEAHLQAAPIPAPPPSTAIKLEDTYTRITATGTFLNDAETQVLAVTGLGRGYWVITPLQTTQGFVVLVNRGFVPTEQREPSNRPQSLTSGPVTVSGLLRLTEPHGGFLHLNNPQTNRWYSRDVTAINAFHHLTNTVPYFIDAIFTSPTTPLPIPGLTVTAFRNQHLSYAFTWFTLAAMSATLLVLTLRRKP